MRKDKVLIRAMLDRGTDERTTTGSFTMDFMVMY
jgi:hypothetical protein